MTANKSLNATVTFGHNRMALIVMAFLAVRLSI